MINAKRPVRTTIFFGLISALVFMTFVTFFKYSPMESIVFRISIFACLSVYSFILASWADKKRIRVLFPLLFLFLFTITGNSMGSFLLLCLATLSWIRSGVCLQKAFARSLFAELIFSLGGGALVASFAPHTTLTWAIGIWMFFLVQSMYFIFMAAPESQNQSIRPDPFEQARMRAESILNPVFHEEN